MGKKKHKKPGENSLKKIVVIILDRHPLQKIIGCYKDLTQFEPSQYWMFYDCVQASIFRISSISSSAAADGVPFGDLKYSGWLQSPAPWRLQS